MADSIPRDFIDLLLTKIDIVDLIHLQIPLSKKSGSNYFARCPFHQEKSASFSVSQPKQFYYCFGCGAHGNAIDFLMNHDHLSFPEAIETLARQAGMEVPRTAATYKKEDSTTHLYELMNQVSHYFYEQMRHSQRAIEYLKQRGISGAIAQQFQLGYAPPGWNHLIEMFSQNAMPSLLETGLIIKKNEGGYYDRFRDRIMFPIHDYRGRIIGFGGRVLDAGEPKYLNSPETTLFQKGHELYGLHQALKANRQLERVLIVEGYMDVIALFQHHITYAVATLGTATTAQHLQRLFRYTSEIIFCFDGDEAGRTAAWRAVQVIFPLMHDSLQIKFLFLPDGEDPDSLIRKEGTEAFEKRLTNSQSLSHFFLQTLSQQVDMSSIEGRARFAALALNHIKQLANDLFQSMLLEELGKRARISLEVLKQQIQQKEPTQASDFHLTHATQADSKLAPAMRLVMVLLIQYPYLVSQLPSPLPPLQSVGYSFLLEMIQTIQQNPGITTGGLLEHWRHRKEASFMAKLASFEHRLPETGIENELLGAFRQLVLNDIETEIARLLAKASQATLSNEEKQELAHLISKKRDPLPA